MGSPVRTRAPTACDDMCALAAVARAWREDEVRMEDDGGKEQGGHDVVDDGGGENEHEHEV